MVSPALLLCGTALAGPGPWVEKAGSASVYFGVDAQRIERLAPSTGSLDTDALIPVDEGLSAFSVKAIARYGLNKAADVELSVPWGEVVANRTDGGLCTALGGDTCTTTKGLAPIELTLKGALVDEANGAPLSLSMGVALRFGSYTAPTRDRLTNIGEGTNDLGAFLSIGHSGGLARGYYYTYADTVYRYRLPTTHLNGQAVPGSESVSEASFVAVPTGRWGLGPAISAFVRPGGVDFEQADLTDPDRFTSLRVVNLSAGLKGQVGITGGTTLSASVFHTAYAENNPLIFSFGMGLSLVNLGTKDKG